MTPRDHYDQVEKSTGKRVYDEPEIPTCAAHIWSWFCDLSAAEFMSYAELKAWAEMTGANPSMFEIQALRAMSRARQEAVNGRHSNTRV